MIEIVFDKSAQGSLHQALYAGRDPAPKTTSTVVFFVSEDDTDQAPTPEEIRAAEAAAAEEQRLAWEASTPMEGTPRDIFGLNLFLNLGDLQGDLFRTRQAALEPLRAWPWETDQEGVLDRDRETWADLLPRLQAGEAARVWYSDTPHEACGLRWLCWEMEQAGCTGPLYGVRLPDWVVDHRGVVRTLRGWGEMEPGQWANQLCRQEELTSVHRTALAHQWQTLRQENAPLRAVVDGTLLSVPADFYDPVLREVIRSQPEEFNQAHTIADALGSLRGISDGWIYRRMEFMVAAGLLEPLTQPGPEEPYYRRTLRKVPGKW